VELFHALRDLPGWQRHGTNIRKTFHVDDFAAATRFVDRIALDAAAAGRQPAIDLRCDRVTVAFAPRDGHTLTLDDVAAARRIRGSSATTATRSAGPAPGAPPDGWLASASARWVRPGRRTDREPRRPAASHSGRLSRPYRPLHWPPEGR
jgi:pterin-4a-carbinolamine dehydratase